MTASNQPHKYRCETCEHFQTRFEYGNKKICIKIRKKFSNSYQIGLPLYTEIVGCASHSDAPKAEPRGRLKCPKCNGPVFIANIDDVDTILCYDDTCKWKQKIAAEPAERRIADVIAELENSIKTGSEIRLDKLIKKLRGELV